MRRTVNILWTGGLDSTFRVAELSRLDVIVQPYYIIDPDRPSSGKEMEAIHNITDTIRKDPATVCELKDLILVERDQITPDAAITAAYQVLREKYSLGSQYDWLARFAHSHQLILEIGLEKSPTGKAFNTLDGECTLIEENKDGVWELLVDQSQSSKEANIIFGQLRFPKVLWDTDKVAEVKKMREMGLEKIVKMTWFCHRPVMGMTCGHCNPCRDALNEGMEWRVSKTGYALGALRRYTYDPVCTLLHHLHLMK